jgi:CRISPR/Cas system-associated exonuclease Cas4 (RecB family)
MSYSGLKEAELCPRRWALRRATYPDIWSSAGYPEVPSLPVLVGDVTHLALEHILREVVRHGCASPSSACAVEALKAMGGYTSVISSIANRRLERLVDNPRAMDRIVALRTAIRARVPEMRQRVQAVLSRSDLPPQPRDGMRGPAVVDLHVEASGGGERQPLGHGSHPEVALRAETLMWSGRADLLKVTPGATDIVDYKTGAPDESHLEQLRIYALLWFRDRQLNPAAGKASRLVVAYPSEDVIVEAPDEEELTALEAELVSRTGAALSDLVRRPPEARPAEVACATCPVRQLCGEYWAFFGETQLSAVAKAPTEPLWGDLEMIVDARNGPRSWWASVSRPRFPLVK